MGRFVAAVVSVSAKVTRLMLVHNGEESQIYSISGDRRVCWHAFLADLPVFSWAGSLKAREISELVVERQNFEAWIVGEHVFSGGNVRKNWISSVKSVSWKRYLEWF